MAKAELEHGDNQWAKDMAQKVIDAQEKEIAEMTAWLDGEGAGEQLNKGVHPRAHPAMDLLSRNAALAACRTAVFG